MNNVTAWETDEDLSVSADSGLAAYEPTVTDEQIAEQISLTHPAPAAPVIKDYLTVEDKRNKTHARLFKAIVQRAYGSQDDVSVGHHISFQPHGDVEALNEIPSADTLIFDHDIMKACFGEAAIDLMRALAALPCDKRDEALAHYFELTVSVKQAA